MIIISVLVFSLGVTVGMIIQHDVVESDIDLQSIVPCIDLMGCSQDVPETMSFIDRQDYVKSPSGLIIPYCDYDARYIQTCMPTFHDGGFQGFVGTVEIFSNCKDPYDWLTCESSTLNFTKNLQDVCEQLMPFNTFDIKPKCIAKNIPDKVSFTCPKGYFFYETDINKYRFCSKPAVNEKYEGVYRISPIEEQTQEGKTNGVYVFYIGISDVFRIGINSTDVKNYHVKHIINTCLDGTLSVDAYSISCIRQQNNKPLGTLTDDTDICTVGYDCSPDVYVDIAIHELKQKYTNRLDVQFGYDEFGTFCIFHKPVESNPYDTAYLIECISNKPNRPNVEQWE